MRPNNTFASGGKKEREKMLCEAGAAARGDINEKTQRAGAMALYGGEGRERSGGEAAASSLTSRFRENQTRRCRLQE